MSKAMKEMPVAASKSFEMGSPRWPPQGVQPHGLKTARQCFQFSKIITMFILLYIHVTKKLKSLSGVPDDGIKLFTTKINKQ